jgi:hypothetical protein
MFTWIPIHEGETQRLLEYKERSHELVTIMAKMKARHFKMMLGFSHNGQKNRPTVQTPLGVFFLNRLA